jgi:hypothetical protein
MRCQAPALFIFHYLRLHSIDREFKLLLSLYFCPITRLSRSAVNRPKKINSLMDFAPAETPTLVMIIHLDKASELHQILSTPRALFL